MQFTLPVTRKTVVLKDYLPHGVYAKVQAALTKNITLDSSVINPTKEQIYLDLDKEEIKRLDSLPPQQYEKDMKILKEEYVKRHINIGDINLQSAEEVNMIRAEGMILTINGQKPNREMLDDLPQPDFEEILNRITSIESAPLASAEQSAK